MAWMLGIFALRYQVNQVVLGVVLIAFASGLTAFMLSQIPNDPTSRSTSTSRWCSSGSPVPGLVDIPVLGPTLFNQTLLVYLMYASVVRRDLPAVRDQVGPAGPLRR